jgi:hypothetical protein
MYGVCVRVCVWKNRVANLQHYEIRTFLFMQVSQYYFGDELEELKIG